jgi:cytochrome c-type biogenesis protein CcmH
MNTDFILSGGGWLGGSEGVILSVGGCAGGNEGSKRGTAGSFASRIARSCALLAILLFAVTLSAQQAPEAEQFVGPPKGTPLVSPQLDQKTQELAGQLRCPVCQGLAIADSPSEMAINMRRQVRELLARGFTDEQILKYFEQSYGQFVLLKPKFAGVNSLVWLLPIAVLAFGALLVVTKMKKLEVAIPKSEGQPANSDPRTANSDPYIQRVRELVEKQ